MRLKHTLDDNHKGTMLAAQVERHNILGVRDRVDVLRTKSDVAGSRIARFQRVRKS